MTMTITTIGLDWRSTIKNKNKNNNSLPSCVNSSKHLMILAQSLHWVFTSFASHIHYINLKTQPKF